MEPRRTIAGWVVWPPQHLSPTLGPGKSYASLLSSFTAQFGLASSYATHCIQEINLHLLDPNGYQDTLYPLTYALWRSDYDTPNCIQAMTGDDAEEYAKAMVKEIQQL